jgi:hypothetical protein
MLKNINRFQPVLADVQREIVELFRDIGFWGGVEGAGV